LLLLVRNDVAVCAAPSAL